MIKVDVAQSIVDSMKSIIHQEINYFSTNGKVIASTDKERIGKEHGGAKRVLKTEKTLIIHHDEEFEGTKQGINIPILLNNNIVGVIGITGEKNEVIKYAEIIKQMTEILIRDNIAQDIIFNKRNSHRFIIDYIIDRDRDMDVEQNPTLMKFLYNSNFELNRVAITGVLKENDDPSHENTSQIYNELNTLIGSNPNNIFDVRNGFIMILIEVQSFDNINSIACDIFSELKKKISPDFIFGIGTPASSINSLNDSIKSSNAALSWNLNFLSAPFLNYNEMGYGIVLHNILDSDKDFFLSKIFNALDSEEIHDIITLLDVYEDCNGSIKKCAEELFVHKNTIQYQLNKVRTLTGYNPRKLNDFFILKLACLLYQTT